MPQHVVAMWASDIGQQARMSGKVMYSVAYRGYPVVIRDYMAANSYLLTRNSVPEAQPAL